MLDQLWQKITFKNSRGLTLAGLLHQPSGTSRPMVVMCHGFSGSKEGNGKALQMGEELGKQGFNVLVFDFSGVGHSQGIFADITITGQIDDLSAAVEWCWNNHHRPIYTLGRSLGGTTAICQAAHDHRVAGVCVWAAPANPTALFSQLAVGPVDDLGEIYALAGPQSVIYMKRGFFTDFKRYHLPTLVGLLAPRPLLLIQGQNDNVVSPQDAELIYRHANEPKQLIGIPSGDHQFTNQHRLVWDLSLDWLKKHHTGYAVLA